MRSRRGSASYTMQQMDCSTLCVSVSGHDTLQIARHVPTRMCVEPAGVDSSSASPGSTSVWKMWGEVPKTGSTGAKPFDLRPKHIQRLHAGATTPTGNALLRTLVAEVPVGSSKETFQAATGLPDGSVRCLLSTLGAWVTNTSYRYRCDPALASYPSLLCHT